MDQEGKLAKWRETYPCSSLGCAMIDFNCPGCGKAFSVKDDFAGKKTKCQKCGARMMIPSAPADPALSPAQEVLDVIPVDPQPTKTIQTKCPFCNAPWAFERRFAGTQITCSKCSHLFRIPQQSTDEAERFIVHQCPMCKKRLHIPYAERGRTVPCVGCKRPIQYPPDAVPQIRSACPNCKAALWLPHNHGDDPVLCPSCNTTHRLAGLPAKDSKGLLARMSEWAEKTHQVIYVSGPFNIKTKTHGTLCREPDALVFKEGVIFKKEAFRIPYNQIVGVSVDTAERMTLTRVVLLGIFAFGFQKKDLFLKIEYRDQFGATLNLVFAKAPGTDMQTLSGQVLASRSEFLARSCLPNSAPPNQPGSPSPSTGKEGNNVLAMIEQLSVLRDKGVLTEEEFQKKKVELLARM
ncbi:MAG TPA: SHOCT domain-containing protein [Gemmataceae bacterium]|nr:SHOCT domain-containing protein [Gemmataceae bacterium]